MGRVECPAQEQNTLTQAGLEPRPLDPESSTLTIGNMSPTVVSKWQDHTPFLLNVGLHHTTAYLGLFKLKNLSTSNTKYVQSPVLKTWQIFANS